MPLLSRLTIVGQFRFCELLNGIGPGTGTLEGNSYITMLEEFCDFSYVWTVVGESCLSIVFTFFVVFILVGFLYCVCRFRSCKSFSGKLLFCVIDCIKVDSVSFRSCVSWSKCILVIWCLTQKILTWFQLPYYYWYLFCF
jgi:hypothetical protein